MVQAEQRHATRSWNRHGSVTKIDGGDVIFGERDVEMTAVELKQIKVETSISVGEAA